jgi:hypothetical protein
MESFQINSEKIALRDVENKDIPKLLKYWLDSTPGYLESMAIDPRKMPSKDVFETNLNEKLGIRGLGEEIINFSIIRDDTLATVFELTKIEAKYL